MPDILLVYRLKGSIDISISSYSFKNCHFVSFCFIVVLRLASIMAKFQHLDFNFNSDLQNTQKL